MSLLGIYSEEIIRQMCEYIEKYVYEYASVCMCVITNVK